MIEDVTCPESYEVDLGSSLRCIKCVPPATSLGGSGRCDICETGYWWNDECVECDSTNTCQGGSNLPIPKNGYWIDVTRQDYLGATQPCLHKDACTSIDGQVKADCFSSWTKMQQCTSDDLCASGSSGRLCAICDEGYYHSSGKCEKCTGTIVPLVVTAGVIGLIVAIAVYLYKMRPKSCNSVPHVLQLIFDQGAWPSFCLRMCSPCQRLSLCYSSQPTGKVKVIVSLFQIVGSISWTTGVNWPYPFSKFAYIFSVAQLSLADTIPILCLLKYSFVWNELFVATLGPLAVGSVMVIPVWVQGCADSWVGDAYIKRRSRFIYLSLLLAYFVLPSTSLVLVRTFLCEDFADGTSFLIADLSFRCETQEHTFAMVYAGICILIYPLGIPLVFGLTLYCYRAELRPSKERPQGWETPDPHDGEIKLSQELSALRILFQEYRPRRYWAEIPECFRRIFLCCIIALVSLDSPLHRAIEKQFPFLLLI